MELVPVLMHCRVATYGPMDVLFMGCLGAGTPAGGAQFKSAGHAGPRHRGPAVMQVHNHPFVYYLYKEKPK